MKNNEIIISKPENVLRTYLKAGDISETESRYSCVIIVVLRGELEFFFSDKEIVCGENQAIFIPRFAKYKIICRKHSENLLFNFQTVTSHNSEMFLGRIDTKMAEEYFEKADMSFLNKAKFKNRIMSLYYSLFSEIFDSKERVDNTEKYVYEAEKIIWDNFSSNTLTCQSIAEKVNISEVYLRKLFAKFRGKSPSRVLFETRMKKARLYIAEGYSVSECAHNVGYSDIYQFSRSYKKYYGYAPRKTIKH